MADLAAIVRTNATFNQAFKNVEPVCKIKCDTQDMLDNVIANAQVPFQIDGDDNLTVIFKGCNAIDFIGRVAPTDYRLHEWLLYKPAYFVRNIPPCQVYLTHERAVVPGKTRISDAGYDLTIVEKVKQLNEKTTLYNTGVKIKVVHGMYAEVVPRSSLSKSGYMLANSIGIIDNSYTGNIMIALTKIDENLPDISLPFRCCQLIFRHQVFVDVMRVDADFDATDRAEKGFGSTGSS
jgi:deoxyuridine 5'-triphosphate nucleotidohydrolase